MSQRITLAHPLPATRPLPLPLPSLQGLRPWAAAHAEQLTVTAVLATSFAHLLRIYDRGFNLLDEGFVLHVAERVLQGQVPYRDFFTQLTPGAFLALAAVFRITGPSVLAGRWVTLLLGLALTAMLYAGARRVASRPTAALAALAFPVWGIGQGWFYPNYSWFALTCAVAAVCSTLRAFDLTSDSSSVGLTRRSLTWLTTAGFLCGAAMFCKQNLGLYTLAALLAATLLVSPGRRRTRVTSTSIIAFAALPIPLALIAWLAANGALNEFIRDAVWIPLRVFPAEMAAPYPPYWPPWPLPTDRPGYGEWAFRLVCLLPPLPYALSALALAASHLLHRARSAPPQRTARAVWLAFGLAIWATAFPRADFDHVQVALGPAFVVGAASFESIGGLLLRRHGPLFACALLAGFLFAGVDNARLLHTGPGWSLRGIANVAPRAAGLKLDHDEAAELNHLIAEVHRLSDPGAPIAALPWNAGLYFLAERRNVTRFDLFIPASVLPDDMPEIEQSLARADLIVYWTPRDPFVNNTSFDDRYPILDRYLHTRFHAVSAVNAYRLLLPLE